MVKARRILVEALLLIALLLAGYWWQGRQQPTVNSQQPEQWVHIPKANSPRDEKRVYIPMVNHRPLTVDRRLHDTIYAPIDTAQVLREYFSHVLYVQKYSDSLLDIEVRDSIGENKLLHQTVRYKAKTLPIAQKENRFFGGLEIDSKGQTGVSLYLSDKHQRIYGLGVTSERAVRFTCIIPLPKRRSR